MDDPKKALQAKEKGNEAFKAGDYFAAVGHYTTAILNNRNDATFPLNRAAAYLKIGKNEDAERDCTTVLQLSKNNLKALFRRGQARVGIGKYKDAQADFEDILTRDPANEAAKMEMQKLRELVTKMEATKATRTQSYISSVVSDKDDRKLKRIPIKIVDDSPPVQRQSPIPTTGDDLLKPVSTRPLTSSSRTGSSATPDFQTPEFELPKASPPLALPPKPSAFQEAKHARTTAKPSRVGGGIFRANGKHTVFTHLDQPSASPSSTTKETNQSSTAAGTWSSRSTTARPSLSLFDFSKFWFSLTSPLDHWNFLTNQISPTALPLLFQTSLEPSLLVSIFQTFKTALEAGDSEVSQLVRHYVDAFVQVPRLNTILLFLNKDEKALVRDVCGKLEVRQPGSLWAAV